MSLFRSEEHLQQWLNKNSSDRGEVLTIAQTFSLAKAWYHDPRDQRWSPRSKEQSQNVLASVGLVSDFWQL